jgi:hypothetical protein
VGKGLLLAIAAIAIAFFLSQPADTGDKQMIDAGKTEYIHTKTINGESKKLFFDAAKNGKSVRWNYDVYTIEGDPIHYTLEYDASKQLYEITIDTREDKFGHPEVKKISCKAYSVAGNLLTGCDNERGVLEVHGEVLLPMNEQNARNFLRENIGWWMEMPVVSITRTDSVPVRTDYTPQDAFFFKVIAADGDKQTVSYYAVEKKTWHVSQL